MELIVGQHGFLRWWAVGFPTRIVAWGHDVVNTVADTFAIKAMASHLGDAIFQDPTWQGRLIGIFIRLFRITVGGFAELLTILMVGFVLTAWYALPVVAIVGIFK